MARGIYVETGSDGKRRYAVDEVAGTFAVSRKSICRHRDKNDAQRQPDKSARPRPVTRPGDTGTLVDQLRKRDPNQPTALRAWRTSHGWQLEPEPLCPAHSISTKD